MRKRSALPRNEDTSEENGRGRGPAVLLVAAYEPGQALESLLEALGNRRIVVVDDGSSHPPEYWNTLTGRFQVELLHHSKNRGKGAALKTGLQRVVEAYPSASGVVTFDADGQHLAEDVIRVAARLEAESDAVILGTRDFSGPVPVRNRIGNIVARLIINGLLGRNWRDVQCGLRGLPRKYLDPLSRLRGNGFDWETQVLFQLHDLEARFVPVPVATIYHQGWDGTSHFRPVSDSLWFLRVVLERLQQ